MASMMMTSRASAGVRPAAARQTAPTARLAAFNGVVSDRVACIHGSSMFQVGHLARCSCGSGWGSYPEAADGAYGTPATKWIAGANGRTGLPEDLWLHDGRAWPVAVCQGGMGTSLLLCSGLLQEPLLLLTLAQASI